MTQEFSRDNRGSAWKNDRRTEEWHAPYRGTAMIDGVEYFIDVYGKKPDANPKAPDITMKFKRKEKQPSGSSSEPADDWSKPEQPAAAPAGGPIEDEIPFAAMSVRVQQ